MPEMRFPTTHWTLLMQARESEARAREALQRLCGAYWYPLFAFARLNFRASPEEAEDVTQGFFEHLLKRKLLSRAGPHAGKFRNFLLVAFKNFYLSGLQKSRALKRGGTEAAVPIDVVRAEQMLRAAPSAKTVEQGYDRAWALEVIHHAYRRTELHYSAQGKLEVFGCLKPFLQQPNAKAIAEAARELGKSEDAVRMEISRLRRTFSEAFRSVVSETVQHHSEVEEEVRYLVQLLST